MTKRDHLAEFNFLTTAWAQERDDYDKRAAAYVTDLVAEIERLRRWGEDAHHVIWQKNATMAQDERAGVASDTEPPEQALAPTDAEQARRATWEWALRDWDTDPDSGDHISDLADACMAVADAEQVDLTAAIDEARATIARMRTGRP